MKKKFLSAMLTLFIFEITAIGFVKTAKADSGPEYNKLAQWDENNRLTCPLAGTNCKQTIIK
jgi:hypothetical protein